MNNHEETAAEKRRRWMAFLIITAAVHIAALIECPNFVVPPRISHQLPKLILAEAMLSIPFVWSVFVLLRYRTLEERVIGYTSLAFSTLWLLDGASLLSRMY